MASTSLSVKVRLKVLALARTALERASSAGISWRWVLFINVPVGAAVIALAPRYLPETDRTTGHFDLLGALTGTLGMTGIVYGFVRAGSSGWSDPGTVAAFVAGAALLGGFLLINPFLIALAPDYLSHTGPAWGALTGSVAVIGASHSRSRSAY